MAAFMKGHVGFTYLIYYFSGPFSQVRLISYCFFLSGSFTYDFRRYYFLSLTVCVFKSLTEAQCMASGLLSS